MTPLYHVMNHSVFSPSQHVTATQDARPVPRLPTITLPPARAGRLLCAASAHRGNRVSAEGNAGWVRGPGADVIGRGDALQPMRLGAQVTPVPGISEPVWDSGPVAG